MDCLKEYYKLIDRCNDSETPAARAKYEAELEGFRKCLEATGIGWSGIKDDLHSMEIYGEVPMTCGVLLHTAELTYDQGDIAPNTLWRPIDSAPKDGRRLLLKSKNWSIADGIWSGRSWIWPYVNLEPMYWMPIPD